MKAAKKYRVVFLRSVRRLLVRASVVPSSPILVTLMKEALSTSETSVLTRATWRNTSQKTPLLIVIASKTSNLTKTQLLWIYMNSFSLNLYYSLTSIQILIPTLRLYLHTSKLDSQNVGFFSQFFNSVAFSPQANYTDWVTVNGRLISVTTFVDSGVSRCQRRYPTSIIVGFLDRSRDFFSLK
jgi:hypothetical protein